MKLFERISENLSKASSVFVRATTWNNQDSAQAVCSRLYALNHCTRPHERTSKPVSRK